MASKLKLTELLYPTSSTAAITINSDDSVTIPTQSTTNLAYTGTLTGGTGVVNLGSGQVYKDASGNVGIGVTPFANTLSKSLDMVDGVGLFGLANGTYLSANAYFDSNWKYKNTATAGLYTVLGGGHAWYSAPSGTAGNVISLTPVMTLDASGNLLVGTTTSGSSRFVVSGNGSSNRVAKILGNTAGDVGTAGMLISKFDNNNSTSQVFLQFSINNDTIANGQINGNGANAAAFGTWSDARLKQNIVDLPSQLANICALRPVEFDYIESEGGGHQTGFVAQEIHNIYPDAVGKRSDGMLTVTGWSKTEARLVKAIQEQQALITDLTTRLTTLEGN